MNRSTCSFRCSGLWTSVLVVYSALGVVGGILGLFLLNAATSTYATIANFYTASFTAAYTFQATSILTPDGRLLLVTLSLMVVAIACWVIDYLWFMGKIELDPLMTIADISEERGIRD